MTLSIAGKVVSVLLLVLQAVSGQVLVAPMQCYPDLGCFSNGPPWTSPGRPVPPPQSFETVGTKIYCYYRTSSQRYNITLRPQIALNGFPINASRPIVFITHGFYQNGNDTWMDMMKDEILKAVNVAVCLVDWGPGAETINYFQAASNTRIVGAETARFIKYLYSAYRFRREQIKLIGFSLGAHAFSYTSNNVSKVFSLTGLEPAQPAFEGESTEVRLDISDAQNVDIVHTSFKHFTQGGFGYIFPNGHQDFYINGPNQPGCPHPSSTPPISSLNDLFTVPIQVFLSTIFCSHARAFMYYTSAIHNCSILGRLTTFPQVQNSTSGPHFVTVGSAEGCTARTCTYIGLSTPLRRARGVFDANTTSTAPYCGSPGDTTFVP